MEPAIPDVVLQDTKDYLHELISIMSRAQRITPDELVDDYDAPSQLANISNKEREHLVIHAWMALSIVLKEARDVAAVATYRKTDKIVVYYAKNGPIDEDSQSHIQELSSLIRNTARNASVSKGELIRSYFSLVHRNLYAKYRRRLHELKYYITMKRESAKPGLFYDAPTPLLLDYLDQNLKTQTPFTVVRAADESVAALSSFKNMYDGLICIINTLKDRIGSVSTERDFESCSFYAYALGNNSLIENIKSNRREFLDLVESAKKLGEYWRGINRLFKIINNGQREYFVNFEIIPICNNISRIIPLEKDWYHVLSCFYYRQTGKTLPFPPNRFKGIFGGIKNYEKYFNDTEFICHCEVILITALMEMKESPTALGISKASCSMCYRFVRGVNEYLKEQRASSWVVGAEHQKVYAWKAMDAGDAVAIQKGNDAVRQFVYSRIMDMIHKCDDLSATESPPMGFPTPPEGRQEVNKW